MASLFKTFSRWRHRQKQVLICGPSGAGKTSLIASLEMASNLGTVKSWSGDVRIFPATNLQGSRRSSKTDVDDEVAGSNLNQRWREARATIREGRLPVSATSAITNYAFDLEMDHYDFWSSAVHGRLCNVRYRLVDGPGGSLLPTRQTEGGTDGDLVLHEDFRSQLIKKARESQALVICVDGNDETQSQAYFFELTELMSEMRNVGERYLRFENIVIVLTKADGYFEKHDQGAAEAAISANPWYRAADLLTDSGMASLLDFSNPNSTELLCGWASAYGFCDDGSSNFDRRFNRMKNWSPIMRQQDIIRGWRPFQILDTFVYLSVGELGSLRALDR